MFSEVNLIKHNHIIGVLDNADNPGKFLINEFISSNSADNVVHVFCYDHYWANLQAELSLIDSSYVFFHDCYPDEKSVESDPLQKFLTSRSILDCSNRKVVVIIDSLSTLLLLKSFDDVYRMLRRSISTNDRSCKTQIQILAFIHEDNLLDRNKILKHLMHLCRVWVKINKNYLNVTIRRTSGKILAQRYEYEVGESCVTLCKVDCNSAKQKSNDTTENLPSSTFKLNLSENEKKARDAVHLPYERNELTNIVTKGGDIYYEPDEHDDWDEEDPDNDLEFS